MLDTAALRCLPFDHARFGEGSMFAPLFETTRAALASEPLLPRFDGSHVSASNARLASTQELRELFDPSQLGALFGHDGELAWLSGDITQYRTPELRQYLMRELDIAEVTPEMILPELDKSFLKAQPDGWILKLYEFLNGQPALRRRLDGQPLIRLKDGSHVPARSNGQLRAFLPSAIETGFPTVRPAVCATDDAWKFLESLGLTKPDPVDDVVRNVLPRYRAEELEVDHAEYEADIQRILAAFRTDSKAQRDKLVAVLRESSFVMAVDAGDESKRLSKPGDLYLATERLKELFVGVGGVLIVDDSYACLRGEDVRELLEACGASRYLKPVSVEPDFTWDERREMRRKAGHEVSSGINDRFQDWSLVGIDLLLAAIRTLPVNLVHRKAEALWDALRDVETRHGQTFFAGSYRWTHYGSYLCEYPSAFARQLNDSTWVPDAKGELQRPEFVEFDSLGWKPSPFLVSKIHFKPPIIETLAKEAGIEPGVLELLKKYGVTQAKLEALLGIKEKPQQPEDEPGPQAVDDGSEKPSVPGPTGLEPSDSRGGVPSGGADRGTGAWDGGGTREGTKGGNRTSDGTQGGGTGGGTRTPGTTGGPPFISYVGAHPDEEEPDSDGLDRQARMALEEKAIKLILAREPELQRTPPNNPGYDLFEAGEDGDPVRWVEVKAMTGSLNDRPVGVSHTQFDCARDHSEAYWLYVVEHAGDDHSARIVRIQNPQGKARTFTFDRGWIDVAEVDGAAE